MRRSRYSYNYRPRRRIKYKSVALLIILIGLLVFSVPRVIYVTKGYSIKASHNIVRAGLKLEYNDIYNDIFSSKDFKKSNAQDYLAVGQYLIEKDKDFVVKDPAKYINELTAENKYNIDVTSVLVSFLNEEELNKLVENEKNEFLEDLVLVEYFLPNRLQEYIQYHEKFRKTASKIVLEVNMNINHEPLDEAVVKEVENPYRTDILVNKYNRLPEDFLPELSLIKGLKSKFDMYLQPEAEEAYEALRIAANEAGFRIGVTSAYRDFEYQTSLYEEDIENYVNNGYDYEKAVERTRELVAVPGHSEHQTGLAVDWFLPYDDFCKSWKCLEYTDAYRWLLENMADYGYTLRYPKGKEKYTLYSFEPWHIRYVGVEIATYLDENNLTLEEWYAKGKPLD